MQIEILLIRGMQMIRCRDFSFCDFVNEPCDRMKTGPWSKFFFSLNFQCRVDSLRNLCFRSNQKTLKDNNLLAPLDLFLLSFVISRSIIFRSFFYFSWWVSQNSWTFRNVKLSGGGDDAKHRINLQLSLSFAKIVGDVCITPTALSSEWLLCGTKYGFGTLMNVGTIIHIRWVLIAT